MHSQFEPLESKQHGLNAFTNPVEATGNSLPQIASAPNEAKLLLEQFLHQVCKNSGKVMTDVERAEMQQELRAHLLAAAAAYEELGTEPKAAMQEAIARFGNAAFIGKELRKVYRPLRLSHRQNAWIGLTGAVVSGSLFVWADTQMVSNGFSANPDAPTLFTLGAFLGFFSGLVVGRKSWKAGRAAFWTMLFQTGIISLFAALPHLLYQHTTPWTATLVYVLRNSTVLGMTGIVTGTVISAMATHFRRNSALTIGRGMEGEADAQPV